MLRHINTVGCETGFFYDFDKEMKDKYKFVSSLSALSREYHSYQPPSWSSTPLQT